MSPTEHNTFASYSSAKEVLELFDLPLAYCEKLVRASNIAIDHGMSEPEGVAEEQDMESWVESGWEKLVSRFPVSLCVLLTSNVVIPGSGRRPVSEVCADRR